MSVMRHCTRLSARRPMPTIIWANRRASTCFFMNAPLPTLTSSTRASTPSASFFDMMEVAISGMDSTVAVASRRAYNLPSAGATSVVCPIKAKPCFASCSLNSSIVRSVRKPGMDSSLSSVPPVWPSPRPDIIGTTTPAAAARGADIILVLSPTPPVECLSTLIPGMELRSTVSPERTMHSVAALTSRSVIPEWKTAMRKADI